MEISLNVLFLPLLGGYLFYCTFHGSQYIAGRRPRSVAIFWWAGVGLILLIVARLATMLASWSIETKTPIAPQLLLLGLPPVLLLTLVGLVLHLITAWLTGASLLSPAAFGKVLLGVVIAVAATWVTWQLVPIAHDLVLGISGHLTVLYLPWVASVGCFLAIANEWAHKYRMPVAAVVFRLAILLIIFVELATVVFDHLEGIKHFWDGFTLPLGKDAPDDAIGLAALACLLGPIGALALNFLLPREVAASRHFESDWVNGFEDLVYSAAQKGRLLQLTLTNRKVYIGHVEWVAPHPEADDAYIQIIPQFSGYRILRTLELKLTTSYDGVYKGLPKHEVARFRKVIPISRIITASEFDLQHVASFRNTIVPAPAAPSALAGAVASAPLAPAPPATAASKPTL